MKAKTVVYNGVIELEGSIQMKESTEGNLTFDSAPVDSGLEFAGVLVDTPIYPVWDGSPPAVSSLDNGVSGVVGSPSFEYLPANTGPTYRNTPDS